MRVLLIIERDTLAASARGNFGHFAKLDKLGSDFLLLEEGDCLGLAGVGRNNTLRVALASYPGKNARSLNSLCKATKNPEIILVGSFLHFDIDH